MIVVVQDLLGDAGENIINLAEESPVIGMTENMPEVNDVIFTTWNDNQPINMPKEAFDFNIKSIAKRLIDKGYNMDLQGSKQMLKDIVNKAIEYGKLHSNKILPTAAIGTILGGVKTIQKIRDTTNDIEKDVDETEQKVEGFIDRRKQILNNTPQIISNIPI